MNHELPWGRGHEAGTWTRTRYQCKLKWPTWRCPIDEQRQRQRQRSKAKRSQSHLKFNEFLPSEKFCGLGWITGRQDDVERRMTGRSHGHLPMSIGCELKQSKCHMPHAACHSVACIMNDSVSNLPQTVCSLSWIQFRFPSLSLSCSFYLPYLLCCLSSVLCHAPAWHPLLATPWRMSLKSAINCACRRRQ